MTSQIQVVAAYVLLRAIEILLTSSAIGGLGVKVIFGAQDSLLKASACGTWLISE